MWRGHEFRRSPSPEAQQTSHREAGTSSNYGADGKGKWENPMDICLDKYGSTINKIDNMKRENSHGESWDSTQQREKIQLNKQHFINGINHFSDTLTCSDRKSFLESLSPEDQRKVVQYSYTINQRLGQIHKFKTGSIHSETVLAWVPPNLLHYTTLVKGYNCKPNEESKEVIVTALRTINNQLGKFTKNPNQLPKVMRRI